jgi:carbonic anhydrase
MKSIYLEGYRNFRRKYFIDNKNLFDELAEGQQPHTMVITCSDSRVNASLILDSKPGELFIARNIGNVVPPYEVTKGATQSAIEYAVNVLKIPNIVVLGHSSCGACAHLYHDDEDGIELNHVDKWLTLIYPAKHEAILEALHTDNKNIFEITEKNNIKLSLQRLMTYPYIVKALENGELELHGWWYNIKKGELEIYDYRTKKFVLA